MKRNRPSIIETIEQQWSCPITSMPMKQPVITVDGHTYEKSYILQWLNKKKTSPKTGLQLSCADVIPNLILKNIIHKFQTQVKYQFQHMSKQIQQLQTKNITLEKKLKLLTQQNTILKQQLLQVDQIKRQNQKLKQQQKMLQQQLKRLRKDCDSLKLQNQQYIKDIAFIQSRHQSYGNVIVEQKKYIVNVKKQPQISFLPYNDYLMSLPVLYQQQKNSLNHSHCPIDMDYFLMHDWSHLNILNLSNTGIQSVSFEKLVNHISEFKNLQNLAVWMNEIRNIKSQTLQKLKHLKKLMFSFQGKLTNPLNDQTKRLLQSFKRIHPQIIVYFEQEDKKEQ